MTTTLEPDDLLTLQDRRAVRYHRREARAKVTMIKRFRGCGRLMRSADSGGVAVKVAGGVAHFSGVVTCGSVWACPVCAAKIRHRRAVDLEDGIGTHLARGGGVEMLTLTFPHSVGDDLEDLFALAADGWREGVLQGRGFREDREAFGIPHYARTIEVTYGRHGWHPHLHVLLFTAQPWTEDQRAVVARRMFDRWATFVRRRQGVECSPAAFSLTAAGTGAGKYLVKAQDEARLAALEFTRSDLKSGRLGSIQPLELLSVCDDGEAWAIHLWREFERVTRGRRCLTWSVGCRAYLGLGVEPSDCEAAAEEGVGPDESVEVEGEDQAVGEVVMVLGRRDWRLVVGWRQAGALLGAVERGGADLGWLLVASLRQRGDPRGYSKSSSCSGRKILQ